MAKKVLILGALSEFVPLVERAVARGLHPVVVDGNPDAPAKERAVALGASAFTIPISDAEAIAALMQKEQCEAITTAYSDLLLESMVRICAVSPQPKALCPITEDMLPYYRDKAMMKSAFQKLSIPAPKSILLQGGTDAVPSDFQYPLLVKPLSAYGSRGVAIVRNAGELQRRFLEAAAFSADGKVLLEEYHDGHEFNAQAFVHAGKVHLLGIADREKTETADHPIPVSTRNVYPSRLLDTVLPFVTETLGKYISLTGQSEGPLCMQFFWSPERGFQVCELTARFLGYEHELIEYIGGPSIEDLLLAAACAPEELPALLAKADPKGARCACVLYFHGRDGRIADDLAARAIPRKYDLPYAQFFYSLGESIGNPQSKPYVLRYYLKKENRKELDACCAQILSEVSVKGASGEELLYPIRLGEY